MSTDANKKQHTIPPQLFVKFCLTDKKLDYSDHESMIKTRIGYLMKQRKITQKSIGDLQTRVVNLDLQLKIECHTLDMIRKELPLRGGDEKSNGVGDGFKKRKIDEM